MNVVLPGLSMKIIFLIIILVLTLSTPAFGDEVHKSRTWFGLFAKKSMNEAISSWQEVQLRYDLNQGQMQQTLMRFGLLKKLNEKHEAGLLMAFIQSGLIKEYRPTLQHLFSNSHDDSFFFNLRSRLEFRDIENDDANSVRYRLMVNTRKKVSATLSAVVWDEGFFNVSNETWTGDTTFERNRLFLGLRIDQSYGRWEVGYLNQYIPRQERNTQEHILSASFFY